MERKATLLPSFERCIRIRSIVYVAVHSSRPVLHVQVGLVAGRRFVPRRGLDVKIRESPSLLLGLDNTEEALLFKERMHCLMLEVE